MTTDPQASRFADEEDIWDESTRAARRELAARIVEDHPTVVEARVTCNQAPLQVHGTLEDDRIFLFTTRYGLARLWITVPGSPPGQAPVVSCSDTLSVDDIATAAALFATLLNAHPEHP